MEGMSRFILQLVLLCAFVCHACGQSCSSQYQTSAKFTVTSQRNQTGHWISQVRIEHGADNNTETTIPLAAVVEQRKASCNGRESFQLIGTFTAPSHRAGPGYKLHRGLGNYKIHSELKTWHEARQVCAQEGGHLAIINSEEESKVLQALFAPVAAQLNLVTVFIGFHDLYTEGQYLTIFDEPLNSTGFYRWSQDYQPNNYGGNATDPGQDCGSMFTNGGLNDQKCTSYFPFICEQELWLDPSADLTGSLQCNEKFDSHSSSEISPEATPE